MTDSSYPSQTSNDELKGLLLGITTEQQKQRDTTTEILVRVKSQDEKIASQATLLANINQRLVKVEDKQAALERKTEKNAQSQEELEGSVLREVGVLAANDKKQNAEIADIKAETKAQSVTLQTLATSVNEIQAWKKAAALLVAGAPGAWLVVEKIIAFLEHAK